MVSGDEQVAAAKNDMGQQVVNAVQAALEDEDEVWKRFVFDGNDWAKVNAQALEEAQRKTVQQLAHLPEAITSDVVEPPSSSADANEMPGVPTSASNQPALNKLSARISPAYASAAPLAPGTTTSSATASGLEFRFHRPQPFVGRLATADNKSASLPTSLAPPKRGRGRPKRKKDESRPNIRRLPDHDDDPLDEE